MPSDIGYQDDDGYYWFVGRENDLIITRSGGNVSAVDMV